MKKILAVLCAAVLALGAAFLLADGREPRNAAASQNGAGVYYLNFKPEQASAWQQVAAEYTRLTGIPVTVVTAASGTYEDALRSELAKSDPPTLFQVNGPTGLRVWRDWCADLHDTLLFDSLQSQEFALFDGGEVPAVAYAIETYGLICNRTLLDRYCSLDGAVISDISDIRGFDTLKAVAEDIQRRKDEVGVLGAFTSAGMDPSSDWRFKTHLANLPLYYESRGEVLSDSIRGTYLPQLKQIWDLYLNNATCPPAMIGARTGEDAASEFALGEAVFYQNGTWAYGDVTSGGISGDELAMLPIYIGVEGEAQQGLCTGSENYWCVNRHAAPEDIEATKAFVNWLSSTQEGLRAMTDTLGLTPPFRGAAQSSANPLQAAAQADLEAGRTPVAWVFPAIPSDNWKTGVGAAMLDYAQGTGDWAAVESAFVEGWARESAASK